MTLPGNLVRRLLATAVIGLCTLYPSGLFDRSNPLTFRTFAFLSSETKGILDSIPFKKAFAYFSSHRKGIVNKRYLTVIDFTRPSHVKRLFVLNRETCQVERYLVSHGKNSGFSFARRFSNKIDSLMSSKGFFLTGEPYVGSHGLSLFLHGQEKHVNDNAFKRGIVIHGADYVSYRSVLINHGRLGRSFGCPAVPLPEITQIVHKLKNGSLLYIYAGD